MALVRIAAVQASYVLMDRQATLDKVAELTKEAAGQGAQLVVFPEVFVPGTPIWTGTGSSRPRTPAGRVSGSRKATR
jgi:nitrilase